MTFLIVCDPEEQEIDWIEQYEDDKSWYSRFIELVENNRYVEAIYSKNKDIESFIEEEIVSFRRYLKRA